MLILKNLRSRIAAYRAADQGIAAIETALLLPILMILYVGMIDLTDLITRNRKLTQATDIIASLTAENQGTVVMTDAQDYFAAVDMVMSTTGDTSAKADLKGYRKTITNTTTGAFTISKIWTATKASGGCGAEPTKAMLTKLMTQGNDIVVATVCANFSPTVAQILGQNVIGKSEFSLSEQIAVRPRVSTQLNCKMTAATGAAACPVG
jgi:uncharacterized membrane protein